jgi:hypothetical protein
VASEYSVNIRLNTAQVRKDLKDIKTDIDKLGKVNLGTNRRTQRTEATITKSKEAQKAAMVETRRIGDLVQKASDQGLKIDKARRAINRAALADGRGEFKVAKAQQKVALEELKIQRAITKEKAQQARLTGKSMAGGPFVSTGIASSRFGSVGQVGSPRFIASRAGMMQGPADPPYAPGMYGSSPIGGSRFMFGSPAQVAFAGSGMGRSPVGGRSDLVGSPANLLSIGKQNTMPVKGFESLVGSPAYYEAQNKEMLRVAKQNAVPVKGFKHLVGSPEYYKNQTKEVKKLLRGAPTGFTAAQFGPQAPPMNIGAREDLNYRGKTLLKGPAGSSMFRRGNLGRLLQANRGPALQSAAISGAFPLLFGQGPLAAAGGALGGGLGGAFGGQMGGFAGGLIGTAVVSGITSFANSITELGKSIETLDGQFNLLTQKSLFSSKEAENRAKVLQALGEREKLATLLSKELTTVLGEGGAKKLREAGEAAKELDKTFAELTINLQLLLVGPLTKFLKIVNDTLDPGMKVSLGEGKGDVIFGGKEEQFIKDFKGVLELFSQGQLDRIFKAAADLQINPADMKARSVLQAEGLGGLSDPELQAIRKFSLGKQVNPQSKFFGGDGLNPDPANNIVEIDIKRVTAAQKKVKAMEKEIEFAKLVTEEGLKEADIQRQIQSITENLNEEELKLLDTQGLSVRALVEKNNQAKQLVENARMIEQSFKSLTQNISTDLAQGIQGLIRGTSTLNDVLNNVLNKMIDAAFNMAFFGNAGGTLTKGLGLFGDLFGGLLASGGPAKAGKSYIVGEKGPELFTPGVSGMVSPNSALGGSTNVVVNVDASGSSVEGDEENGRELGRMISVAIQSELIKQKRPGGLLT